MILDDNPANSDLFHFSRLVDALTSVVDEIETTPFVIGILGPWGCGKTTLMQLIRKGLLSKHKTIWFNPWKYDNKEAIWNAFIQSILVEVKREIENDPEHSASELIARIRSIGKKLAWYSLKVGASKLTQGIIDQDFIQSLKDSFSSNEEQYEFINKFEDTFSKLLRDYSGDNKIIIFIDDLDRCVPENAITVLESIKLFLDGSNCVFIIGLEKEIVEKGIHFRYKEEIDFSGKDYLEKIIQLPFTIPVVPDELIVNYMKSDVVSKILPTKEKEKFIKTVQIGLEGNIRKIKRFVNNFYVMKLLSCLSDEDFDGHCLMAKVLVIQMRYPKLYELIKQDPKMMASISKAIEENHKVPFEKFCNSGDEEAVSNLRHFLHSTKNIEDLPNRISNFISLAGITS